MLDQDSARLLVSEALRDKLLLSDEHKAEPDDQNQILCAEFIFSSRDSKFSFKSPLVDIDLNDEIFVRVNSNIQDAHELFSLLQNQKFICENLKIYFLEKSTDVLENFKANIRKISNIDYIRNQCIVSIELIKSEQ